jgi:hypothetical protein
MDAHTHTQISVTLKVGTQKHEHGCDMSPNVLLNTLKSLAEKERSRFSVHVSFLNKHSQFH